jgi:2-polyprenyl-3-methyl-5-hydroxy-6-metoxy-1,4-benzoquinol methylase
MREEDIRPKELFNRYLALADDDIERFFRDMSQFVTVPCPACAEKRSHHEFIKHDFYYATCPGCGTLYLSPRPSQELYDRYYKESKAVKFWSEHFYKETAEARRERMFMPRAETAVRWAKRLGLSGTCIDVGPGYGIFMEEMIKLNFFKKVIGIESGPDLANSCRQRGLEIIEKTVEGVTPDEVEGDFVVNFEVLEHVYSPLGFLRAIRSLLKPNGALLLTTLTVSGFDIQELWMHSKSVHPPHHINLISLKGMEILFAEAGFKIMELSTPGKLDVNIIENTVNENPDIPVSRFARRLIEGPQSVKDEFQSFLSNNRMSSHVRVVAQRAG